LGLRYDDINTKDDITRFDGTLLVILLVLKNNKTFLFSLILVWKIPTPAGEWRLRSFDFNHLLLVMVNNYFSKIEGKKGPDGTWA
jgi:hypothetical protein